MKCLFHRTNLFLIFLFFVLIIPSFSAYALEYEFKNPITGANSLGQLIESVIGQLQPFVMTLIAVAIIYIGFRMVVATSSGNPSELKKWRNFLVYALIGAVIVAGAKTIVGAVRIFAEQISKP